MARTKTDTQNNTNTLRTPTPNKHSENTIICVFRIGFSFVIFIYNFLNVFPRQDKYVNMLFKMIILISLE